MNRRKFIKNTLLNVGALRATFCLSESFSAGFVNTGYHSKTIPGFTELQEDKSYLNPPRLIKNPASTRHYSNETRKFTGIPSTAINHNGRMWAIWYTGPTPGEDRVNYGIYGEQLMYPKLFATLMSIWLSKEKTNHYGCWFEPPMA